MERDLNHTIMSLLKPWYPMRVENSVGIGCPDIECAGLWIESKFIPRWPKTDIVVPLRHFTPQQRCWHIQRGFISAAARVVLRVGNEDFVLLGNLAAINLGKTWKRKDIIINSKPLDSLIELVEARIII